MDFKSHLPVQTHKDGTSFTGKEYTVVISGYEDASGTVLAAGISTDRELFVVDQVMRDATHLEDDAFVPGSRGMYVLAVRQDVLVEDTDADGDFSSFKVSDLGELYVKGNMTLEMEVSEDDPHVSGQAGILAMAVRNDLHAVMTDADGDNSVLTTDKTGAMRVTVVDPSASNTELVDHSTSASVAVGVAVNHDYTVPVGTVLKLDEVSVSASGRVKMRVLIDAVETDVKFNSTATPNIKFAPLGKVEVAAGTVLRVEITNMDEDAQDVYSTFMGYLI